MSDEEEYEKPAKRAKLTSNNSLYLDTVNRQILDFDLDRLCSVSLSSLNIYACLVCGRFLQGKGPSSHAFFHSLEDDHHVFMHLDSLKVFILPDNYQVEHPSFDDIKVSNQTLK